MSSSSVLNWRARALAVDDDPAVSRALARLLEPRQIRVTGVATAEEAVPLLDGDEEARFDLALVDVNLPGMSGPELVERLRRQLPTFPTILMSGEPGEAARLGHARGAYAFLTKPFHPEEELFAAVERALERTVLLERTARLASLVPVEARRPLLVGEAPSFARALAIMDAVAPTDSTVLIRGESGTGKELVARSIHGQSARAAHPFVAVNCGAFNETLLDSELFGHARGAFTGAVAAHKGVFRQATGGTIFLDEVGEMSLATQVRLLRVLEERRVRPVGATEEVPVDVRVVAATHVDLEGAVREGRFREDLYYRLNVVAIQLPPLRERREDIPSLVRHFVQRRAERMLRPTPRVSRELLDRLVAHSWPGNLRELGNVIERCMVLETGEELTAASLPDAIGAAAAKGSQIVPPQGVFDTPFAEAIATFQRSYLTHVLEAANGNIAEAARRSGLDRANLRRMLRRHGIVPSRAGEA